MKEKGMSPMFPRLHVSETEKGGPRAPPRNKMALYEQFSVPSRNLATSDGSSRMIRPPYTTVSMPSSLPNLDVGEDRAVFPPSNLAVLPANYSNEKLPSRSSDKEKTNRQMREPEIKARVNIKTPAMTGKHLTVVERIASYSDDLSSSKSLCRKTNICQDGYEVPTTVQSGALSHKSDGGKATCADEALPCQLSVTKKGSVPSKLRRQQRGRRDESYKKGDNKQVEFDAVRTDSSKPNSAFHKTSGRRVEKCLPGAKLNAGNSNNSFKVFGHDSQCLGLSEKVDKGRVLSLLSIDRHQSQKKGENCPMKTASRVQFSQQLVEDEPNDDTDSSGSIVDSMSSLHISPDDVVGVIGQKQFWKARKAIVNQQRVFAVQIFELHRLIKVQKLIAGEPQLLVDDQLNLKSPKSTLAISLPPARLIEDKPIQAINCPSKNATEKTCVRFDNAAASSGVASQSSDHGLFSQNPLVPVGYDSNAGSWCFPSHSSQWLVPVMSPSEGLLYKPYTGPYPPPGAIMAPSPPPGAFMTPIFGGGTPVSPQQQPGMGGFPSVPSYYPPYGYPIMSPIIPAYNIEQANLATGAQSEKWQAGQFVGKANCKMQSKNSCNMSNQKIETNLSAPKLTSKDRVGQLSTASSPSDRRHEGTEGALQDSNALLLFPVAVSAERSEGNNISSKSYDCRTHAIKVVPHNRKSASESAARIFRSIQEERSHNDSH